MGDSDDDFERRHRDKFRGERSDYGVGGGAISGGARDRREDGRRREEWPERGREGWAGRERGNSRREYGREFGRPRERYSPMRHDMSPPMKRMRHEHWEERRYPYEASYGHYGNYPQDLHPPMHGSVGPGIGSSGGGGGPGRMEEPGSTQPPMMSFKAFVEQCDDSVSEEDAMKKYSIYKLEFKKQQIDEFFINHKDEEWFKSKYHPEEFHKRNEEQVANLKRRVRVFLELEESKRMESITVDADQSDNLLKLLDSVVIKLEGGTDYDLQVLDLPSEDDPRPPPTSAASLLAMLDDAKAKTYVVNDSSEEVEEEKKKDEKENQEEEATEVGDTELQKKAKKYLSQKASANDSEARKRKRASSESSSGDDEEEEEPTVPGMEKEILPPGMEKSKGTQNGDSKVPKENGEADNKDSSGDLEEQGDAEEATILDSSKENDEDLSEEENEDVDSLKKNKQKPRPLHKTTSIFLRNLAPTITKQEVEAMCRRYSGFLRAAIADPQPDRRWFRRGWVAFKRDVNIKDICWNLNSVKLRDCELGAIVNRDLTRRIRTVNGITSHKAVVRADIKLSAKIIQNLDSRWSLWSSSGTTNEAQPMNLSESLNPVLRNITDFLIEEANAEEEELLGGVSKDESAPLASTEDKTEGETIQRDPVLIKVLDRLLLYLRIVHSVDYYNHSEYPNEDEMPNRCGIMHARGIPPSSKITPKEIQDYCRAFENKIGSFLQPLSRLSDEDAKKLGLKNDKEEVEKFVKSNCQKVDKDKWQCPLCSKKFKAEEFVQKHIINKHDEKFVEVEKDVEYFNNYLRDAKRPQLPEYPGSRGGSGQRKEESFRGSDPYVASYPQPPMYGYGLYGNRYPAPGGYGGYGASSYPKDLYNRGPEPPYMRDNFHRPRASFRSRSGNDPRGIVGYQDLDTPEDVDMF